MRGKVTSGHGGHWSIKNYNAFVRAAKAEHGISHRAAQQMYRSMGERTGRSLYAADLRRHPVIAKQEAAKGVKAAARAARQLARELGAAPEPARSMRDLQRQADRIKTVAEHQKFVDSFPEDLLDWEDFESSEDPFRTGKDKK